LCDDDPRADDLTGGSFTGASITRVGVNRVCSLDGLHRCPAARSYEAKLVTFGGAKEIW